MGNYDNSLPNLRAMLNDDHVDREAPPAVVACFNEALRWHNRMCQFRIELSEQREFLRQRQSDLLREIKALEGAVEDINMFLKDGGSDGEVAENSGTR